MVMCLWPGMTFELAANMMFMAGSFFLMEQPLGSEFIINQNTTNNQGYPAVTGLPNGNVFVAWYGMPSGDYDIYGRVFFPNGTALGE